MGLRHVSGRPPKDLWAVSEGYSACLRWLCRCILLVSKDIQLVSGLNVGSLQNLSGVYPVRRKLFGFSSHGLGTLSRKLRNYHVGTVWHLKNILHQHKYSIQRIRGPLPSVNYRFTIQTTKSPVLTNIAPSTFHILRFTVLLRKEKTIVYVG